MMNAVSGEQNALFRHREKLGEEKRGWGNTPKEGKAVLQKPTHSGQRKKAQTPQKGERWNLKRGDFIAGRW